MHNRPDGRGARTSQSLAIVYLFIISFIYLFQLEQLQGSSRLLTTLPSLPSPPIYLKNSWKFCFMHSMTILPLRLCSTVISDIETMYSKVTEWSVNELGNLWKKAFMTPSQELSRHCPEGIEENC
jgi:hypothetical protein